MNIKSAKEYAQYLINQYEEHPQEVVGFEVQPSFVINVILNDGTSRKVSGYYAAEIKKQLDMGYDFFSVIAGGSDEINFDSVPSILYYDDRIVVSNDGIELVYDI